MGTVLTHPFLCLNRYKQNDRTTYIICYHSVPYSFTNKPEIGVAKWLAKPVIACGFFMEPTPEHSSKWYSPSETVAALMKMYQELTEKSNG